MKDVNEGLNKSIKNSVTNVAEETSGFLKESADKTLTKNIKNGNFTDIDVNKLGKGNKKLSTRIADEVKSSDALTKHRNALSEIAKNPKNYGSDVSKYAGDLLKELDPDRIAKDVIESFNSNQKHVRNYFTESLKESKPTRAGRRNNKRIAKANKKGKELKDPN